MHKIFHAQNRKTVAGGYSVTFNISSNEFIQFENVVINFDGIDYTTNSIGQVVIMGLLPNNYVYTITAPASTLVKNQYMQKTSSLDIIDSNLIVDSKLITGYGCLYNQFAALQSNLAPSLWAVPSSAEYTTLKTTIGVSTQDDINNKLKEAGSDHWSENIGTLDSYGLSFFGGGARGTGTSYAYIKYIIWLWTADFQIAWNARYVFSSGVRPQGDGNSLRLIYTGTGTPTTLTDYDGNIYDVILIGSQYWTKQNWKCTHLNDGTLIPNVTSQTTWANLTTMALCYYNNDENNA